MRFAKLETNEGLSLRIPCVIDARGLPISEAEEVIDIMRDDLGAKHFGDKDLLVSVLTEAREAQQKQHRFDHTESICLYIGFRDDLRMAVLDKEMDLGGHTVYAPEQFKDLVRDLKEDVTPNVIEKVLRKVPEPSQESRFELGY